MGKSVKLAFWALWFLGTCVSAAPSNKISYLHFINALILERKGNYVEALEEYKKTITLDPQSVFVYKQALNLAIHVGKFDDAQQWADYVVSVDSSTPDNWVLHGNVQWARGEVESARKSFEKALQLDKENANAVYQLASLHSTQNPEKSIEYLNKYIKLKPEESAEIYYQIAILYNIKGSHEEMRKYLLKSIEEDSMYLQPKYMLAQYYEIKGDTASAVNEYLSILPLDFSNVELINHLGEIYINSNNPGEAEKYFLQALELDKTNPVSCFWLAIIFEHKKDYLSAVRYVKNSRDLNKDPNLWLRLSYYKTRLNNYNEAVSALEEAHKIWPDNIEVTYFLALGLEDLKKTAKAVELLKEVIKKDPAHHEARFQYAVISEKQGNIADAEEHFKAILEKNPNNATVLNYLGYSLADRGLKLDEAEKYILKAVEMEPKNGAYLDSLGWVHFKQGKVKESLPEIKQALKYINNDGIIWEHLGDIFSVLASTRNAWYCWKIAKALNPKNKGIDGSTMLTINPERSRRIDAKIKNTESAFNSKELGQMFLDYLKTMQSGAEEFSSFCKIHTKFNRRQFMLDGIVRFKSPEEFSVAVMGPLFVPMWKINLKSGQIEMDSISIKGVNEYTFSLWAVRFAKEMRNYFSGSLFSSESAEIKTGWSATSLKSDGHEIQLKKDMTAVGGFKSLKNGKGEIFIEEYDFTEGHFVPRIILLKMPFLSLKITMDNPKVRFRTDEIPVPE